MKSIKYIFQIGFLICFLSISNNLQAQWQLTADYGMSIDAATYSPIQESILFFNAFTFKYYTLADDSVFEPYPLDAIAGLPADWEKVDASCTWNDSTVLMFNKHNYVAMNLNTLAIEGNGLWEGLPAEWDRNLDAAVNWDGSNIFFFLGGEYVSFDLEKGSFSEVDLLINWEGWPAQWQDGFTSCLNVNDGSIYFFKEDSYITYDIKAGSFLEVLPVVAE